MTRPLRLEFAGALYHVTSRGDRGAAIYLDNADRRAWLDTMDLVATRFNFIVHAFCQMTNHYHVLIETAEGNLAQGMRQLNGLYSQYFNRRHRLVGHLFQGRYKAILVQRESYLLELTRYVVLNPLRAGMVAALEEWPWSSHQYMLGDEPAPLWLDTKRLLGQFGERRSEAVPAYVRFVMAGIGLRSPLALTAHQMLLGDAAFVARHQQEPTADLIRAVSKPQRRALVLSLPEYAAQCPSREEAMAR